MSAMLKDFLPDFLNTGAEHVDINELDDEAMIFIEFWYGMGTETILNLKIFNRLDYVNI